MTPKLAVFTKNLTNPAYAAARLGADRIATRLGATTAHYVPAAPDDAMEQMALIRAAILERPDAIVLVPAHETAVNSAIEAIHAAAIPLFTFVTPVSVGAPLTFVGSDDRALGAALAHRLCAEIENRGRIVIVEGTPASATSHQRSQGFAAALRSLPDIEVVATIVGNYQRADAREAFAALPLECREADGVLCANDVMALGVLDVLERGPSRRTGRKPLVVGVNALPEAIAAIRSGRMLATADFDAMSMCALATEAAIRHLRGEFVPREIDIPVQIVDAANAATWDRPFESRPTRAWADVAG